jgi:UDPglucose 6-dehydrogenase
MKIIIAGYGYVGKAVTRALDKKHEIVIVDPKFTENKITDNLDAEGLIICVPTPSLENGNCDASIVYNILDNTPIHIPVLIKSTISPDIINELEATYSKHWLMYSPEFLRARSADFDFLYQKYMVLGGEDPECYWQTIFQESLPECKMIFNCSMQEASLIKYASNSFLALKTSYFNYLYEVCLNTNMDFSVIRQILTHDQRIGSDHSMVPGPDGERGWGGHCFPKDTLAFVQWAQSVNAPIGVLETAIEYNNGLRKSLDKQ